MGLIFNGNGDVIKAVDGSLTVEGIDLGGSTNINAGIVTGTSANFTGAVSVGGVLTYEDVKNVDSVGIVTARTGIHIDDSITHIGDTNTKIRFPAADTITAETGGSERLRIDSSGRLLVGLTASIQNTAYLQLKGINQSDISLYWPQDAATAGSQISWRTDGGGAATEIARIFCGQATTGADGGYMTFQTHNGTSMGERLRITSAGKVGINEVTPTEMLHIKAEDNTDSFGGIIVYANNNSVYTKHGWRGLDSNEALRFAISGTEKMRLTNVGKLALGRTSADEMLHITAEDNTDVFGGIKVAPNNNSVYVKYGWRGIDGSDQLRLATAGTERLRITSSGAKVTGTLELTDSLYWDGDTNTTIDNAGGTADFIRFKTGGTTVMDIDADQHVKLHDNRRLRIGASNDIQIFHNSGNDRNYFFSPQNDVYHEFAVSNSWTVQTTAGDKRIHCPGSGTSTAVELYHNGTKKFETTSLGSKVTGKLELTGNLIGLTGAFFADNNKASFGNGDDLEIFHDGNNHIRTTSSSAGYLMLKVDSNNLYLDANETRMRSSDGGEILAKFIDNGANEFYHDNTKRLETTSTGATVSGSDITLTNTANAGDASLYMTAGEAGSCQIKFHADEGDNATDKFRILVPNSDGIAIQGYNGSGWDNYLKGEQDEVSLYHNNVEKIRTTTAGCTVFGDGSNYDTIKLEAQSASGNPSISFGRYGFNTTSRGAAIKYEYVAANNQEQGHLQFYTNPSYNGTGSLNRRFQISSNGDLLADDTTIGSLSDSRLKKNIADYTYDLAKFKQLKPKTFDWINPEEHIRDTAVRGFVAQEVKTVDDYYIKESTFGNKKDKELITDGKGLTSKLGANDAMYVSVINQLITKIETLESEVAALKGS